MRALSNAGKDAKIENGVGEVSAAVTGPIP